MRRLLSLVATVVAVLGTTLLSAGPASALGGEWAGCRIVPTTPNIQFTQACANRTLFVGTYTAGFHVFNTSGTYSIAWTLPSGYTPVFGCGNEVDCSFNMSSFYDQWAPVSVTLVQNGASVTLTAGARINAVCSIPGPYPGAPRQAVLC